MIQALDLRKLCTIILENTINDPDKYQNGLTKIFFRAGMLAALESLRSNRLNAMVTVVQKNMRRRMAVKKYQQLRASTIRIQTWWRGILAKRFVEHVRREAAAVRLQRVVRRFVERQKFLNVHNSVVLIQSRKLCSEYCLAVVDAVFFFRYPWPPNQAHVQRIKECIGCYLAAKFASWNVSPFCFFPVKHIVDIRASISRRAFRADVKHVIYLQSCIRRRLARKQLKTLRQEARSVSKFKEISYKLENKVVELTQNLQTRTQERKELQAQVNELEQRIQQWTNRHEEADSRAKQLQVSLQAAEAEVARRDELLQAKADTEKRLEEALAKAIEKEEVIQKLTDDLLAKSNQLEQQQRTIDTTPVRNQDDSSVIMTLKSEVNNLREQLNRSNALNSLTRGSRPSTNDPPLSPTFAPGLRGAEANGPATSPNGHAPTQGGRHQRRHSSAGVYSLAPLDNRTSTDEIMLDVRRNQALNPRAVSVAYNGDSNFKFNNNGLPGIRDDDPAEEKIRLMQDIKHLDEDILDGLIRGLKIPAPSLTNPSAVKEILFPANLISLVTNEMWKYGLIPESERFLANVMQTIQSHVMVSCLLFYNKHLLMNILVLFWRRCYCSRHLLAVECSRDAFFHLCRRERHASGYRPRRGEFGSAIRLERLRATRFCGETRFGQSRIQHLPHLDARNQEEALKNGYSCTDRESITSWIHDQ